LPTKLTAVQLLKAQFTNARTIDKSFCIWSSILHKGLDCSFFDPT